MKKIIVIIAATFAFYGLLNKNLDPALQTINKDSSTNTTLFSAIKNQRSHVQVAGSGTIIKKLADDTHGSKHQKFILKLSSGQTLLVVHNIDLAPRIHPLYKGDTVNFYGEYEWTAKGGVVHWTHHDPKGRHEDGWLKHNGTLYQ